MADLISSDIDYYNLLGIDINAKDHAIRRAYRKKALGCHPDKNPDNPKAAELFLQLSKALSILTDFSSRSAYDQALQARKAAELRKQQLNIKRRKLIDDLEQRERNADTNTKIHKSDDYVEQLECLRRASERLMEEYNLEQSKIQCNLVREMQQQHQRSENNSSQFRIKITWKADKKDVTNGGYNQEILLKYLKKYGDINALVLSKKNGRALVEFQTLEASEMALAYEKGCPNNPIHLEWVQSNAKQQNINDKSTSTVTSSDFEDLVMRKLRQAEERKRLIAQILKEEADVNDNQV